MPFWLSYIPIVNSLVLLLGVPCLFYYGRKFFAEKENAVSPLVFQKQMTDGFEKARLAVVNELNTSISAGNGVTMMRLEGIGKELVAIREDVKEASMIGRQATDEAKAALHAVEVLQTEFKGYRELMDERLRGAYIERRTTARD